jgi:hypothetical protein
MFSPISASSCLKLLDQIETRPFTICLRERGELTQFGQTVTHQLITSSQKESKRQTDNPNFVSSGVFGRVYGSRPIEYSALTKSEGKVLQEAGVVNRNRNLTDSWNTVNGERSRYSSHRAFKRTVYEEVWTTDEGEMGESEIDESEENEEDRSEAMDNDDNEENEEEDSESEDVMTADEHTVETSTHNLSLSRRLPAGRAYDSDLLSAIPSRSFYGHSRRLQVERAKREQESRRNRRKFKPNSRASCEMPTKAEMKMMFYRSEEARKDWFRKMKGSNLETEIVGSSLFDVKIKKKHFDRETKKSGVASALDFLKEDGTDGPSKKKFKLEMTNANHNDDEVSRVLKDAVREKRLSSSSYKGFASFRSHVSPHPISSYHRC